MKPEHRRITSYLLFEIKTPTASPVLVKEDRRKTYLEDMQAHLKAKNPGRRYEIRSFDWAYSIDKPVEV